MCNIQDHMLQAWHLSPLYKYLKPEGIGSFMEAQHPPDLPVRSLGPSKQVRLQ